MLDKFKDECGVFGIFGHPEAANLTYLGLYALQHRGQESAGIATADGEKMRISRAMGHVADAFDERGARVPARAHRHRAHALLDRGREPAAERAADPDRLRPRPDRDRAQRQPGQRGRAARAAGPRRIDLPDQQRHRGGAAPLRALARAHGRRRAGRVDLPGQRGVFVRAADEGSADRRARSARLPPARARAARRRLHRLLRNLRARSDRRHLHPRRRARRGADHQRRRAAIASTRSRRRRSRTASSSTSTSRGPTATSSAGASTRSAPQLGRILARGIARRRRRRQPDSRLGRVRRDRVRRSVGDPDGDGADPQPLRRPHVHPAAAGDPALQRPDQAESGAQRPRRAARRS